MQAPSSSVPPIRAANVAIGLYKPCACLQEVVYLKSGNSDTLEGGNQTVEGGKQTIEGGNRRLPPLACRLTSYPEHLD